MLGELRQVLDSLEFEEQGSVQIVAATWRGRVCSLTLDVAIGGAEDSPQSWEIVCAEERESRVDPNLAYDVVYASEHVLLAPHSEPQAMLAFRGRAADVDALFTALWERHRAWSDGWFRFEHYLNPQLSLLDLLAAGGGILAEGPLSLLRAYAGVLDAHGVESSVVGTRQPLRWLDGAWQPEPAGLGAIIIGQSYVIGRGFDVRRLAPAT